MRRYLIFAAVAALLIIPTTPSSAAFKPCANPTIKGTPFDDFLLGTGGRDVIRAYSGDDVIYGLGGGDVICGNRGNDRIKGENHATTFAYGGGGRDTCIQVSFERAC